MSPTTATPTAKSPAPMHLKRAADAGIRGFRAAGFHPVKFLRRLGAKLARAMRIMSMRTKQRSSGKVSSSSPAAASLVRSRSCADPITDNSHREEAIGDCIEFLNSSALQRSNTVASACA